MADKSDLEKTKELMGALIRQPPKLHDEMKLGKRKAESVKSPEGDSRASGAHAKPKSA